MPSIFISYRRGDSLAITGRIDDHLADHFGRDEVFLDLHSIDPGDPFPNRIRDGLNACLVLLAIIGERWVTASTEDGSQRLFDENDYVRLEIETALAQGKVVIPVVVDNANWPAESDLPESLRPLLEMNATFVESAADFPSHTDTLIRILEKHCGPSQFEKLTAYARKRLAEEATKWLDEECDPFVMPSLSRRVAPEVVTSRRDVDPWDELTDDDCRRLVLGRLPDKQKRVRIFSDSGMGKTTLLHHCEQQIAESDEGRVPVRVISLSNFDWRSNVIAALANRVLHAFLPTDTDASTRVEWLRQLIRDNKIVFLFDAVDQTDDQLAGFGQFMQSADVMHCPATVTGRPEVEQTRARVFHATNWDTLRVEPFDEERIREYLGDLSDTLLPTEDEEWEDEDSFSRKQQWQDLLHVPLLLRLMRRLAIGVEEEGSQTSLDHLHNRHSIYREAVRHLVAQGWKSLHETPLSEDLLDHDEVEECLTVMAWVMVSDDNFTSVFQGQLFRRWRSEHRKAVRALEQVDLTTRYSLLDNPGKHGLAWRHLSFCEYFAGLNLAGQDRDAQEAVAREHGRNPSWQWVFRFALSEMETKGNQDGCAALARDLIRFGNPFLVFDAISGDELNLPENLDSLCRWLLHLGEYQYREAWKSDKEPPPPDDEVLGILETLFERPYRDSRCLHAAWDLLESSSDPLAAEIRSRFLAEFGEMVTGADEEQATARSLSVDECFMQCPPAGREGESFQIGENAERSVHVEPFYLAKTPITNRQFELFDPSHERWRDQYSPDDDSPALYVSWYMAVTFCRWLGEGHRLPTEDEWEVAYRAGTTTAYWWGDDFDESKCNSRESNLGRATPANPAHANAWGFMEMSGNVFEWCEDYFEADSNSRVLRGGSFASNASVARGAFRYLTNPGYRSIELGFRVARTYP